MAEILSQRTGLEISGEYLVSLASAFGWEEHGTCWRALQELVERERHGTPAKQAATKLNDLSKRFGKGDCSWPTSFHLKAADVLNRKVTPGPFLS